jgi:gluconate kinase
MGQAEDIVISCSSLRHKYRKILQEEDNNYRA